MARRKRDQPDIDASSMADIAFLLLIFFLVATHMVNDKGVNMKLPPFDPNEVETKVNRRNVYDIVLKDENVISVRGEDIAMTQLKGKALEFILNPNGIDTLAESPNKAVLAIQIGEDAVYQNALDVYNEVNAIYNELWNRASQSMYGKEYAELGVVYQAEVKKNYPKIVSEKDGTIE